MLDEVHGAPFWCTPGLAEKHNNECDCVVEKEAVIELCPESKEYEIGDFITGDGRKVQPCIITRTFVYYLQEYF